MQLTLSILVAAYFSIFSRFSGVSASSMEVLSNNGQGANAVNRPLVAQITTEVQNCGDPRQARPFYRLWNPTITDHLYTIDRKEYENASSMLGYLKDGIVGYVFANPQPNAEALFRLWNPETGDHFYTRSVTERNLALKNRGYKDEGVAGYLYADTPQAQACGQPLYRLLGSEFNDHFYTGSVQEKERWIKNWNYTSDGITGWFLPY